MLSSAASWMLHLDRVSDSTAQRVPWMRSLKQSRRPVVRARDRRMCVRPALAVSSMRVSCSSWRAGLCGGRGSRGRCARITWAGSTGPLRRRDW